MNPATLNTYYSGLGQQLPSVASRASQYSTYGLGTGYTGTAAQNTALLQKLQSTGTTTPNTGGYAATPTATSTQPSSGGYSSDAPGGDPNLSTDMAGLNQNQTDYQKLVAQQAAALNDPNTAGSAANEQGVIAGAYQTAAGQTGVQSDIDAMNKIQDALNGSQNASAAVTPQTVAAARGSFANNDQVNTQESTSNIPYAEQVAQLSANLVPAENAATTAMQQTNNIAGNIVTGAQLAEQGFTQGQQEQLAAIQSKIDQGQQLTNDEYQSYATLKAAQTGAAATTGAAGIAAGASTANTTSTNALNKYLGQLTNPGSSVGSNGVGTFNPAAAIQGNSATPTAKTAISSTLSKYGF